MKTVVLCIMASWLVATPAAAERLDDKALGQLIARIASEEDRFRDALDPQLKRSTLRGPNGEVNVERFLGDFSDAAERLEDRFEKDYSASTEAGDLLRQATQIDQYFHRDQAATRGESEWNAFAVHLQALAAAYGTTFPLPAGATTRRIADREVIAAAEGLARDADRLKTVVDRALKQDASVDKATREGIVREIGLMKKDAQSLRSAVKDRRPSSAQATQVLGRVGRMHDLLGQKGGAAATPIMGALESKASLVSQAYGMAPPLSAGVRD